MLRYYLIPVEASGPSLPPNTLELDAEQAFDVLQNDATIKVRLLYPDLAAEAASEEGMGPQTSAQGLFIAAQAGKTMSAMILGLLSGKPIVLDKPEGKALVALPR